MSRGSDRGQATVELALCLPFILLLIGSAVEITAVSVDNIRVWHATREAARVAAVEPDPSVATRVATDVIAPIDISISPPSDARVGGEPVVVEASYRPDADVPVIGQVFERLRLTARVAMRIEVP
jgi:Flp pilus assembly protein TadG